MEKCHSFVMGDKVLKGRSQFIGGFNLCQNKAKDCPISLERAIPIHRTVSTSANKDGLKYAENATLFEMLALLLVIIPNFAKRKHRTNYR